MPYIGKSPVGGGFHKLDNLTASATATYALTLGGAAYYPETANQLLVSLNGVIQAPQDSFTVSGSNLIFDSALTASDSIDFVVALGDVLGVGSVSDGAITTAKIGNGAVTDAKLATSLDLSGKTLTMPSGAILQVLQTPKTDTFSTSSTSFTDITGLSVNITPLSTSSKILVFMDCKVASATNVTAFVRMMRDSTPIYIGDAAGSRQRATMSNSDDPSSQFIFQMSGMYLDSPSTTSQITYKVQMLSEPSGNTGNVYLNRSDADTDNDQEGRYASSITVMEIAG